MSEVVELFRGGRFSEDAAAVIIGKFYSLIARGLAESVERHICEEGGDEISSLIDSDGLALYTVGLGVRQPLLKSLHSGGRIESGGASRRPRRCPPS